MFLYEVEYVDNNRQLSLKKSHLVAKDHNDLLKLLDAMGIKELHNVKLVQTIDGIYYDNCKEFFKRN